MATTDRPKGHAFYFPSIEKTYGACQRAGGVPQVAAERLKTVALDALNWRNPCWN